jgi:hypothetical protein
MKGIMMSITLLNVFCQKSGSVAVSTALVSPILILMMCGVVDLGRATYDATSLAGAVRVGAQYALRFPDDKDGIILAVKKASTLEIPTVVPAPKCECPNGTTAPSCAVSACGANVNVRKFVTIFATSPFSKIMPSSSIIVPAKLSATSVVRAQ